MSDYDFLVGTVVGFHALAGEVKIKPSTNNPELLLDLKTVRVEYAAGMKPSNDAPETLKVRESRLDRRMLLMSFRGLKDRTAVEHLEGAQLYARESELLPLDEEEFWVRDLVGMEALTTEGRPVGKVIGIIYGGNDILEIQRETDPPGKTILVPFVKDLVPVVNTKEKRIEIRDVPGLLEPQ